MFYWGIYRGQKMRLERSGAPAMLEEISAPQEVELKVVRDGINYFFSYRVVASESWTLVGVQSTRNNPQFLGLIAKSWEQASVVVDFDYLRINERRAPPEMEPNFGLALGWRGSADTDLQFSEFFYDDHTIMTRFMLQYPYGYAGPLLGENGSGTYMIGQGDYRWGNGGYVQIGDPVLFMKVGSQHRTYVVSGLQTGQWHQLAVVRTGDMFKFYLNGRHFTPDLTVASTDLPQGNLRVGRRTSGRAIGFLDSGYEGQFYGLIADVAVFRRALSDEEIRQFFANNLRLTGEERDLYAGWTFDPAVEGQAAGPLLSRPVYFNEPAQPVRISAARDGILDYKSLHVPPQQTPMQLPFPRGQVWKVIQGGDVRGGSHNGFASFAWDFAFAGAQPETRDAPFNAAGPGVVVKLQQNKRCAESAHDSDHRAGGGESTGCGRAPGW